MGFFAVQFMVKQKIKNIKFGVLVFLPVYFIFLHHSMQSYHSHFFSGGIVITHTHPFDYDGSKPQENNTEQSENQIIIFHGFSLDLGDNIQHSYTNEYFTSYFTKIILPVKHKECVRFYRKNTGRAPPEIFA